MATKTKELKSVRTMINALNEYRGFDASLIIEMEESAGDIIGACDTIATVLEGFCQMPQNVQNEIMVKGVMARVKRDV